jgi:nitroreductase
MYHQQSMIDTMKKRRSIRTFTVKRITDSEQSLITTYIQNKQNLIGPFGNTGKMEFVPVNNNITDKGIKLGTYGFIKNPAAYLVGIAENSKYSLLDFAYCFQKLILFLNRLGMGTCWMGGTFNRHSFEKEILLNPDEFIPCITPIGYPADKARVLDKTLRFVVKADNKKSWEQLFYDTSFAAKLTKELAGPLEIPIEMVRLGPSASNKQPWRIVLSEERHTCHFFIEHTPNYSSKLGYDMQILDMGIAMCQFDSACRELKIDGRWELEDPGLQGPNDRFEYIATWKSLQI